MKKYEVKFSVNNKRIIVADSLSFIDQINEGDVIVCGSHGGKSVVEYVLKHNLIKIGGLIVNDAGIGKDKAGIFALEYLDKYNIPVAAVSNSTARIGEGEDVYNNGIISAVNNSALEKGVRKGMKASEASIILLGLRPERSNVRYIYNKDEIENIIIVRLRPESDVIPSIEMLCKENNIDTCIILNMIGSLRQAQILLPKVENGNVYYTEPIKFEGPLEFLSGQGFVIQDKEGLFVHIHGTFSDSKGNAYGGHLNKVGNIVLATLDLTIAIPKSTKLKRLIDKDVNIGTMWFI